MFLRLKPASKLGQFQRVDVSADEAGLSKIASYSQRDIENGMAFTAFHTPKAYVTVSQPPQNFTVDLNSD